MGDLAETLEALATCEQALEGLTREVERLPGEIANLEGQAAESRARLESERQALVDLERKRREQDAELQDCETRRDRFRGQTAQVKTNAEYHALLHEIDQVTQRISDLEEESLVSMEEVDRRGEEIGTLEGEHTKTERDLMERAAGLRERLDRARQEITALESERDGLVERLGSDVQSHYRRVMKARGRGTTRIQGRTCASCYYDVPYETVNRVVAGEFRACMGCNRILVAEAG